MSEFRMPLTAHNVKGENPVRPEGSPITPQPGNPDHVGSDLYTNQPPQPDPEAAQRLAELNEGLGTNASDTASPGNQQPAVNQTEAGGSMGATTEVPTAVDSSDSRWQAVEPGPDRLPVETPVEAQAPEPEKGAERGVGVFGEGVAGVIAGLQPDAIETARDDYSGLDGRLVRLGPRDSNPDSGDARSERNVYAELLVGTGADGEIATASAEVSVLDRLGHRVTALFSWVSEGAGGDGKLIYTLKDNDDYDPEMHTVPTRSGGEADPQGAGAVAAYLENMIAQHDLEPISRDEMASDVSSRESRYQSYYSPSAVACRRTNQERIMGELADGLRNVAGARIEREAGENPARAFEALLDGHSSAGVYLDKMVGADADSADRAIPEKALAGSAVTVAPQDRARLEEALAKLQFVAGNLSEEARDRVQSDTLAIMAGGAVGGVFDIKGVADRLNDLANDTEAGAMLGWESGSEPEPAVRRGADESGDSDNAAHSAGDRPGDPPEPPGTAPGSAEADLPGPGSSLKRLLGLAAGSADEVADRLRAEVEQSLPDQRFLEWFGSAYTRDEIINAILSAEGPSGRRLRITASELGLYENVYGNDLEAAGLRLQMGENRVELAVVDPAGYAEALRELRLPDDEQERAALLVQNTQLAAEAALRASGATIVLAPDEATAAAGGQAPATRAFGIVSRGQELAESELALARELPRHAGDIADSLAGLGGPEQVADNMRLLAAAHREGLTRPWAVANELGIIGLRDPGFDHLANIGAWSEVFGFLESLKQTAPDAPFTRQIRETLLTDINNALDALSIYDGPPSIAVMGIDIDNLAVRDELQRHSLLRMALERVQSIMPDEGDRRTHSAKIEGRPVVTETIGMEKRVYTRQPNADIFAAWQNGNPGAGQIIADTYLPSIEQNVNSRFGLDPGANPVVSRDDLVQAGIEYVLRRAATFKPGSGEFSTYINQLYRTLDETWEAGRPVHISGTGDAMAAILKFEAEKERRELKGEPPLKDHEVAELTELPRGESSIAIGRTTQWTARGVQLAVALRRTQSFEELPPEVQADAISIAFDEPGYGWDMDPLSIATRRTAIQLVRNLFERTFAPQHQESASDVDTRANQRRVLALLFGLEGSEQVGQGEVAERLGISIQTVKTLRSKGIMRLHREVQRMRPGDPDDFAYG